MFRATKLTLSLVLAFFCGALLLSGCQSKSGEIRSGETLVASVPNPGKPATLNTASQRGGLRIPKNSRIVRTEYSAQPERPATENFPAAEAQAARVVTEISVSESTEWVETKETLNADTGTIDTSVAKHEINARDKKWLLIAAIGCGIAGIVLKSMLPAWPGLSTGLLIAAPVAFAAWKLSEVPSWLWLVVLGVVGLMALGYKRAEWDKNKNGIPDLLEKS